MPYRYSIYYLLIYYRTVNFFSFFWQLHCVVRVAACGCAWLQAVCEVQINPHLSFALHLPI